MKVLSLFDGISVAQEALKELNIPCEYLSSEIDKYAIQITMNNFPNTKQLGDVRLITKEMVGEVELLIGGSPCQDLSIAKKNRQGLNGERSGLFWEYVRILKEVKPKYFVLENVNSMPKEAKQVITETLGVESVMINASLVSAQNRKRLFWVGKLVNDKYEQVIITQPIDRGILLKDVLETKVDINYSINKTVNGYDTNDSIPSIDQAKRRYGVNGKCRPLNNWSPTIRIGEFNTGGQGDRIYSPEGKSVALSANGGGRGAKTGLYKTNNIIRKLTAVECERLQSLQDGYTQGISNSQRYKCLGNAFNCEVIKHILKKLLAETYEMKKRTIETKHL